MLPNEMKALVLKEEGFTRSPLGIGLEATEPYLELKSVPVPQPQRDQVLIKVHLAAVNPSDISFIKGIYGQPRVKGQPAGFEGVGEVMVSGGGFSANRLKGKRVAFAVGPNGSGSWAEFAVADAATCIAVRDGVRDEDGAAMIVNPISALAMFGIVKADESRSFILTAGASQLSKLICGLARDEGYRAIAIVRRDEQIPLLMKKGATHVFNATSEHYRKQLTAVIGEEKPRVLLDAVTGTHASFIFESMPPRTRWVIYGRLAEDQPLIRNPNQMVFQGKRIEGFWLADWMRRTPTWRKLLTIREAQKRFSGENWTTDVTARLPMREVMSRLVVELSKPNGKVFVDP